MKSLIEYLGLKAPKKQRPVRRPKKRYSRSQVIRNLEKNIISISYAKHDVLNTRDELKEEREQVKIASIRAYNFPDEDPGALKTNEQTISALDWSINELSESIKILNGFLGACNQYKRRIKISDIIGTSLTLLDHLPEEYSDAKYNRLMRRAQEKLTGYQLSREEVKRYSMDFATSAAHKADLERISAEIAAAAEAESAKMAEDTEVNEYSSLDKEKAKYAKLTKTE